MDHIKGFLILWDFLIWQPAVVDLANTQESSKHYKDFGHPQKKTRLHTTMDQTLIARVGTNLCIATV